jgi:hypothetical protein
MTQSGHWELVDSSRWRRHSRTVKKAPLVLFERRELPSQQLVNLQNLLNYRGQLDVPSRGACKITSQSFSLSDWQPTWAHEVRLPARSSSPPNNRLRNTKRSTMTKSSARKAVAEKARATYRKTARKVSAGKAHSRDRKTASKVVAEKAGGTYRKTAAQFEEFARDAQMPESLRALAEKSVAQTRALCEHSLETVLESWERFVVAAGQGAVALNRKAIDIARRNINTGFGLAVSLAGAKNPAEVMELQAAYWRKQFGDLTTQAGEMPHAIH